VWLLSTIVATGLVPAVVVVFVVAALLLLRLSTHRRNQAQVGSITGNWSSNTNTSASHVHKGTVDDLSPMQAEGTFRVIPAPLWQEVEIPADRLCIVQTSAGQDWMLGQGSYGKVSYT